MITEAGKRKVIKAIEDLPAREIKMLNQFTEDERKYIINLARIQTRTRGFEIELDGTAADPSTHTKFRKLILPKPR